MKNTDNWDRSISVGDTVRYTKEYRERLYDTEGEFKVINSNYAYKPCFNLSDGNLVNVYWLEKVKTTKQMKHNFPSGISTVCNRELNKQEINQILKLAIEADITIDGTVFENKFDSAYPYYGFDETDGIQQFNNSKNKVNYNVTFNEFLLFFEGKGKYKAPFKEEIKISDSYTAIITQEGVKVGCITLSHSLVKQIYQSSLKAQKSL